jgi:heat shock protein HslJ
MFNKELLKRRLVQMSLIVSVILIFSLLLGACKTETNSIPQEEDSNVENSGSERQEELIRTMYIASEKQPCVGVGEQMCMLVRYEDEGEWKFFYNGIDGFVFVPGFEYELRVQEIPVADPPADGSSIAYQLVEMVGKVPAVTEQAELEGSDWVLRAFGEEHIIYYASEITMRFEDGKVNGNAGCNNFFGSYEIEDGNISFGPLGMTMMACDEVVMVQETEFLRSLESVGQFEISGNMLQITYAAGQLTFEAQIIPSAD